MKGRNKIKMYVDGNQVTSFRYSNYDGGKSLVNEDQTNESMSIFVSAKMRCLDTQCQNEMKSVCISIFFPKSL